MSRAFLPSTWRRSWYVGALLGLAALLVPAVAAAHPLGNFSINHYSGIRISTTDVLIDHVTDFAEIPTYLERTAMDTDKDGDISDAESAAYQASKCAEFAGQLDLRRGNQSLALETVQSGLSFPPGQGGPTTRLVCVYQAALTPALSGPADLTFADNTYAEKFGWREIVIQADGTTVTQSAGIASDGSSLGPLPVTTNSTRLTLYPTDLLSTPDRSFSATISVQPGGPALAAFSEPDAFPISAAAVSMGAVAPAGSSDPAAGGTVAVNQPPPAATPAPVAAAAVPNGVTDLSGDIGALFQTKDLTPTIIILSFLAAALLGALHALTPGHGKTVMAAYLVGSRGSTRHALGLGLTVTVSHTIGVLALGAVTLSAASFLPPEKLYPFLGITSGVIFVAIGVYLVATRVRAARRQRATARAEALAVEERHAADHAHGLAHDLAHTSGLEHDHAVHGDHEHRHEGSVDDHHVAEPGDGGWHSHSGRRHTHLPPAGAALSWRGLFALGLAGGMVPSVTALIVFLGTIAAGRPAYGILLTIGFGVGMAVVLIGVGLSLVYARGFIDRMPKRTVGARLSRWVPMATPFVVLGAGLLMTVEAFLTL